MCGLTQLIALLSSTSLPQLKVFHVFLQLYWINTNTVFTALPCENCKTPHGTLNITSLTADELMYWQKLSSRTEGGQSLLGDFSQL